MLIFNPIQDLEPSDTNAKKLKSSEKNSSYHPDTRSKRLNPVNPHSTLLRPYFIDLYFLLFNILRWGLRGGGGGGTHQNMICECHGGNLSFVWNNTLRCGGELNLNAVHVCVCVNSSTGVLAINVISRGDSLLVLLLWLIDWLCVCVCVSVHTYIYTYIFWV